MPEGAGPWSAIVDDGDAVDAARRAIVRGQNTFNTRTFTISGVAGLNGQTFPNGVTIRRTQATIL